MVFALLPPPPPPPSFLLRDLLSVPTRPFCSTPLSTFIDAFFADFFAVKGAFDTRGCRAFPGGEKTYVGMFFVDALADGWRGVESIVVGGAKWNCMSSGRAGDSPFRSGDAAVCAGFDATLSVWRVLLTPPLGKENDASSGVRGVAWLPVAAANEAVVGVCVSPSERCRFGGGFSDASVRIGIGWSRAS